jgi:tRNA(Ile)-lysidine synthase
MISKVEKYIETHINKVTQKNLFTDKPNVIIGLSGGPDSVALLHIFSTFRDKYSIAISAAHLDHGWRKESEQDLIFCKNLCEKLKVPFYSAHAANLSVAIKSNGSKEEVGRKLRQFFFSQIKEKIGADYVALAHHQQDQQETFFLRLIRGCSLSGLVGIRPVHKYYIRPLLAVSRQEIINYLKENNSSYIVDKSNDSDAYLRNRIRKYLLPQFKKIDPRFDQKFSTTLQTLQDENDALHTLAFQAYFSTFAEPDRKGDVRLFCSLGETLQKRVIVEWLSGEGVPFNPSQAYLLEILRFIRSPRGGSHQLHLQWSIVKKKNRFWVEKH